MKKLTRLLSIVTLIGLSAGMVAGCTSDRETSSETHFLAQCQSTCAGEFSCICGVCTVACDSETKCSELSENALCVTPDLDPEDESCREASQQSTCTVACRQTSECWELSDIHRCIDGSCSVPTCVVDGSFYREGQKINKEDESCGECTCLANGEISCPLDACQDVCSSGQGPGADCLECSKDGCLERRTGCYERCREGGEGEYCEDGSICHNGLCQFVCSPDDFDDAD